ncbi:MAG TPA: hypothetical protein P5131_04770 [Methanoculleus sp.]|nr:hypothetical protein [Methanoculleus sp.]
MAGFDDCVHLSLLHPGIAPEDLHLERETPGTSGLERPILVAVPMRLPCIGAFVLGGSCLLEGLLEHRLVEEPGDAVFTPFSESER